MNVSAHPTEVVRVVRDFHRRWVAADIPIRHMLTLRVADPVEVAIRGVEGGHWFALPLLEGVDDRHFALDLHPSAATRTGVVMELSGCAAMTMGRTLGEFLDFLAFRSLIGGAKFLRRAWHAEAREGYRRAVAVVGGDVAVLDVIERLLFDEAWLAQQGPAGSIERNLAFLTELDRHPSTQAFAALVPRVRSGEAVPEDAELGCWRWGLESTAFFMAIGRHSHTNPVVPPSARLLDAAIRLSRNPGGVDADAGPSSKEMYPSMAGTYMVGTTLGDFIRRYLPDSKRGDLCVEASRHCQSGYPGSAHVAAAAALDLAGEPHQAWNMLVTASFWARRYVGAVPLEFFKAAVFLAERNQFANARWLRFVWERYLDAHPEADRSGLE